jgi:hypothetical protein
MLIDRLGPDAVTLLHGLPGQAAVLGVAHSDELAFSCAGSHHYLKLRGIISAQRLDGDYIG